MADWGFRAGHLSTNTEQMQIQIQTQIQNQIQNTRIKQLLIKFDTTHLSVQSNIPEKCQKTRHPLLLVGDVLNTWSCFLLHKFNPIINRRIMILGKAPKKTSFRTFFLYVGGWECGVLNNHMEIWPKMSLKKKYIYVPNSLKSRLNTTFFLPLSES